MFPGLAYLSLQSQNHHVVSAVSKTDIKMSGQNLSSPAVALHYFSGTRCVADDGKQESQDHSQLCDYWLGSHSDDVGVSTDHSAADC